MPNAIHPPLGYRYLVTSALPYANGPIHFGHVAGAYLPADIFVRFLRLKRIHVLYICGTDEYGAAITLAARREGISPREVTDKYHQVIRALFDQMQIEFDNFSRTTWPRHAVMTQRIFLDLVKNGHVLEKGSQQHYCPQCAMFLPDRYIAGTCYICGHANARGDECRACGSWIDALRLKEPSCVNCGNAGLEVRETRHWYLNLPGLAPGLKEWLASRTWWKHNVVSFIRNMIDQGLEARPITRDLDWGVPVPLPGAEGKVLYVWFDAPIGYISSTIEWAEKQGSPDLWQDYWYNPDCRLVHFIGKDNIPFHTVVWPSVLMGQDQPFVLPFDVPANEFYNLEGAKFNKSAGWYIDVEDFFTKYSSDSIRYCIARNAPENNDSEFTWRDFQAKHNDELADIYGNLAARTLKFVHRYYAGRIPPATALQELDRATIAEMEAFPARIGQSLTQYRVRDAAQEFMSLARLGNRFIDASQPWRTRQSDPDRCATSLHVACRLLAELAVLSSPFIPTTARRLWAQLGMPGALRDQTWDEAATIRIPADHPVAEPEILFNKIDDARIEAEIETLRRQGAAAASPPPAAPVAPIKDPIDYSAFSAMDLRVGIVREAEAVPHSKKLVRLQVDLGIETRQVVAGIAEHYQAADLIGRKVVVVANLAPRKLMGLESRGMVLAAVAGGGLALLDLDPARADLLAPGSPVQ